MKRRYSRLANLDEFEGRYGLGKGRATFAQSFDVHLDRFADARARLFLRPGNDADPRKIGRECSPTAIRRAFINNEIFRFFKPAC